MKLLNCVFVLLSASLSAVAQVPLGQVAFDPRQLAEAFVRGQLKPATAALTGEALANPIDPTKLPKSPKISTELLWKGPARALVAAEFSNERSAQDLYLFLDSLDGGWRIAAFRDVVLPGVFYNQLNHYRNLGEASLRRDWQARYEASASRGVSAAEHERVHGTADDKVFFVFNLRLTSSSDRDLARHFEFLKPRFEAVRQAITAMPASALALGHDNPAIGADLQYLLIKRAYQPGEGPLRLEIASIEGDDVGYLYCADPACMPTPTPGGVIALRALGDGWWLYRTT